MRQRAAHLSIPTPCPKTPHRNHAPTRTHTRRTLTRGTRREDWGRGYANAFFPRCHSTHEPPPRTLGPELAATHATPCLSPHPHLHALPSLSPNPQPLPPARDHLAASSSVSPPPFPSLTSIRHIPASSTLVFFLPNALPSRCASAFERRRAGARAEEECSSSRARRRFWLAGVEKEDGGLGKDGAGCRACALAQ